MKLLLSNLKRLGRASNTTGISCEKLSATGADFVIMSANSSHYAIELLRQKSSLPILSIVDVTIAEIVKRRFKKFAILGIGMTMSHGLYEKPLKKIGVDALIPSKKQQEILNAVILKDIIPGKISEESTQSIVKILEELKDQGCDSIGLCRTELPIVIREENCPLPFIDTTRLLAKKAVEFALKEPDNFSQ